MLGSHSRSDALRGPLRTFAAARRTCYTPDRPYRGRTTFVTVDNPTLDGPANRSHHDDLARAWKGLAPELVVVHAPGNHVTVLKPPHVAFLSTLIEASMR
jgi:arthrofactin-type cyclic lipopeptide synthetase C